MTSSPLTRQQTLREEIANSISHGIGFLGAVAITPLLIIAALPMGASAVTGASIFGATMMILYLCSSLYHAFPHSKTKSLFQVFDHSAIFLLIAGTYTAFTLSVLPNAWGWALFGVVWGLAILGVILKALQGPKTSKLSIALYLGMGWLAVVAVKPFWEHMPAWGLFWLLAGGVMYSGGVLFFAYDHRIRFSHFVWHLFVIAGTTCHVVALFTCIY